jgi:hypothetical protein
MLYVLNITSKNLLSNLQNLLVLCFISFFFNMHHLNIFHHKTCFAKCSGGLIHKNWNTICFQYNIKFYFIFINSLKISCFVFHFILFFMWIIWISFITKHVGNVVCHYPWLVASLNVTTSWSINLLIWFFSQHYTQSIWTIVGLWHS